MVKDGLKGGTDDYMEGWICGVALSREVSLQIAPFSIFYWFLLSTVLLFFLRSRNSYDSGADCGKYERIQLLINLEEAKINCRNEKPVMIGGQQMNIPATRPGL